MKKDSKKKSKDGRSNNVPKTRSVEAEERRRLKLIATNEKNRKALWDRVIAILPTVAFNASEACRKIGVSRNTFSNWENNYEEFRQMIQAVRDEQIDWVETQLMKQIANGDGRNTRYWLNNFAKSRGYKPDTAASARININTQGGQVDVRTVSTLSGEAIDAVESQIEDRLKQLEEMKLNQQIEFLEYEEVDMEQSNLLDNDNDSDHDEEKG